MALHKIPKIIFGLEMAMPRLVKGMSENDVLRFLFWIYSLGSEQGTVPLVNWNVFLSHEWRFESNILMVYWFLFNFIWVLSVEQSRKNWIIFNFVETSRKQKGAKSWKSRHNRKKSRDLVLQNTRDVSAPVFFRTSVCSCLCSACLSPSVHKLIKNKEKTIVPLCLLMHNICVSKNY